MTTLQNRWALITGASSGLGADFARALAKRGCPVVLVARRKDRLEALAQEIEGEHHVRTLVVPMSLSRLNAAQDLYDRLAQEGITVDVLVNNAGFGLFGPFVEIPWERQAELLQLDVVALVHLTKLFVKDMVARDFGYVLQVASTGAYQPTPTYAVYAAAKAFVLSFGEALSFELRKTQVKVSVLAPGVTATEFLQVSGQKPTLYQRVSMMQSRRVVEIGVQAMLRGTPSRIPGVANTLTAWSTRLMPRRVQAWVANRVMT